MRIALGIEYEGTDYYGWQMQQGLPSIQGCLEHALSKIANQTILTTCAGRTDAGVHAAGQVVHFDTTAQRSEYSWIFGTSRYLPEAIKVRWAHSVQDDFHARHSALARHYHYLIYNYPQRPIWQRHTVSWYYLPLNEQAMQQAAHYLIGEHDFSSFRGADCQSTTPIRNVMSITITRQGHYILLEVKANSFLHHMVRNIAGVLLQIGAGKKPVEWAQTVLHAKQRTSAGITAPPQGLYLVKVEYPDIYQIPQIAQENFWYVRSLSTNIVKN